MRSQLVERRSDIVLSSGFLGFASHLGFLTALVDVSFGVDALVGTSSGALVGVLFAAGMRPREIEQLLTKSAPISHVGLSRRPWRGMFELGPLLRLLERELPQDFAQLPIPVAVGVTTASGEHRLINSGPLPLAVAASCAVPVLFEPVCIAGQWYRDGGRSDRVGLRAWQTWRPQRAVLVHRIERSMGVEATTELPALPTVVSPRSRNTLLGLRDFEKERDAARDRTSVLFAGS